MTTRYARPLVQIAVVLAMAVSATGCSTVADLDPTGLLSEDTAPLPSDDDSAPPTAGDQATTTPDLAAIPVRPPAPDTAAQANTAQSVAAAGSQAQYSADALRAGTEAAAPPPGAADLPPTASPAPSSVAAAAPAPSALDAPPTASDNAAPPMAQPPQAAAAAPPPARVASAAPPPAPVEAPTAAAPVPSAAPATASVAPPVGTEPAVPAVPRNGGGTILATANPSDAALGFKPSAAPALNPSISQWVSAPILAHYRQTAALAGTAGTSAPAVPAVADNAPRKGRRHTGMGGPAMSGDVVANLDAVPGSPAGMAAAMNGGVPPTAIVYFSGDGTALPASAKARIREAVAAFNANGGIGTIKVVGHASSRTANMPVERHLEAIFDKSQKRATVVAQALIRAGVPADKVMVEAVGDSQPVYYESMPKGEEGNRRAEIFVQG